MWDLNIKSLGVINNSPANIKSRDFYYVMNNTLNNKIII